MPDWATVRMSAGLPELSSSDDMGCLLPTTTVHLPKVRSETTFMIIAAYREQQQSGGTDAPELASLDAIGLQLPSTAVHQSEVRKPSNACPYPV